MRPRLVAWVLGAWSWDEDFWEGCVGARVRAWGVRGRGAVFPSDLMSRCPVFRDVFLRRRVGVRLRGAGVERGRGLHEEALGVWRAAVEGGLEGLLGVAGKVGSAGGLWALSSAFRWLRFRDLLPVRVEPSLPGWAGFGGGRPDLVVGPFPVELVSGGPGGWSWSAKKLVLAGYGFMLEHAWGVPVDVGFLVSLGSGVVEPVCLGDDLRVRVLELVDRLEEVLEEDPGLPGDPESCPRDCPFREYCLSGGRG